MRLLSITLILFISITSYSSQTAMGLWSNKVKIWRCWEKTDSSFVLKTIVYNISDSTVKISANTSFSKSDREKLGSTIAEEKDIINTTTIGAGEYRVFEISIEIHQEANWRFFVNDKAIGTLSNLQPPPNHVPVLKYSSDEGVNGVGAGTSWISRNKLINTSTKDTIKFHAYYHEKGSYSSEGLSFIEFNYDYESVKIKVLEPAKNLQLYDFGNCFVIQFPFEAETWEDTNDSFDFTTTIDYEVDKKNQTIFGWSGILFYDSGYGPGMGFSLPIFR